MASKSPTARTLEHFRGLGQDIGVVERWVQQAGPHGKRFDLFGFIDLIAMDDNTTIGIQATSTGNMSSRLAKIKAIPEARRWVAGKNRKLIIIGWKKYAKAEGGKWWRGTFREVTLEDFDGPT